MGKHNPRAGLLTESEAWAWAVGLFDGEGCISRTSNYRFYLRLTLRMSDEDTVQRFQQVVGAGTIRFAKAHKPGWSDTWDWSVAGPEAERIVSRFEPYLSRRRSRRLSELREAIAAQPPPMDPRTSGAMAQQPALIAGQLKL